MNKKQTNKKEVKNNFYLTILSQFDESKSLNDVAKKLNISKQNLNYYIRDLKEAGLIEKKGYGVWDLTERGKQEVKTFSLGMRPIINLHAFIVNVPILEDDDRVKWDKINKNFNNWTPKYKNLDHLNLKIEKTTKSVNIFILNRNIKDYTDIYKILLKSLFSVYNYLKDNGIIIDYLNPEVKNINLAIKDKILEEIIPKELKFEIESDKITEKILWNDKEKKCKIWTDKSPFRCIETNDVKYLRNYLKMPDNVDSILSNFALYNNSLARHSKDIELHLDVLKNMDSTLKGISRSFCKFNKLLSEKLKSID